MNEIRQNPVREPIPHKPPHPNFSMDFGLGVATYIPTWSPFFFRVENIQQTKMGVKCIVDCFAGHGRSVLRSSCNLYSARSRNDFARRCHYSKVVERLLVQLEENLRFCLKS